MTEIPNIREAQPALGPTTEGRIDPEGRCGGRVRTHHDKQDRERGDRFRQR